MSEFDQNCSSYQTQPNDPYPDEFIQNLVKAIVTLICVLLVIRALSEGFFL